MYDVEKRSAVLANATDFARRYAYIYGAGTKWRHWGTFIHWNRNAIVRITFFTGRHSSGSSPKVGCLCS